ncbi:putative capsid protein [Polycipiviridae sp.]|nr:putative capsid protein [Polycipiviridae sp.]
MSVFQQLNNLGTGNNFSRNLQTAAGNLRTSLSNFTPAENSIEEGIEAVEGAEATATAAAPELALIQIGQQIGNGLNSILNTISNNSISNQYQTSISTGHGIGLVDIAQNQATSGYAKSSLQDVGGKIGALLGGPLGALAGRGIAGLFSSPVTNAIANSPTGMINPQSGTTPQSQSSKQPQNQPQGIKMATIYSNNDPARVLDPNEPIPSSKSLPNDNTGIRETDTLSTEQTMETNASTSSSDTLSVDPTQESQG